MSRRCSRADNQLVTGLVTGDAKITLDPTYTVPGQVCIQQSDPIPRQFWACSPPSELEGGR